MTSTVKQATSLAESVAAYKAAEKELARWKGEFYMVEVWEPLSSQREELLTAWVETHGGIVDSWVSHESHNGYGIRYFVSAETAKAYEAYEATLQTNNK